MRNHIARAIGQMTLQQLSGGSLNAIYRTLSDQGLSSATVRRVHATPHHALHNAVRWNKISRNPADVADPPKASADAPKEMLTWAPDELAAFFAHVQRDRLFPLYVTVATTGVWRGELLGLRPQDVHLDAGGLEICQALASVNDKIELSTTKTGCSRSVSIDPVTVEALKAWKKRQAEERLAWGPAY